MQYGTVQINIAPLLIKKVRDFAQKNIPESYLAGKGLDTGTPHVTVYYGLEDENYAPLQDVANRYMPFYATLGKISSFPATKHSDGAAVLIIEIASPIPFVGIHRAIQESGMNLRKYDFSYTPHVTLAYVKPDYVETFKGLTNFQNESFRADELVVSNKEERTTIFRAGKQP